MRVTFLKNTGSVLHLLIVYLLLSLFIQCSVPQEIVNMDLQTPQLQNSKDGNYYGSFKSKMVKAGVMVQIDNHKIQNINLIEHDTGLGKKAEVLLDSVLVYQTVEMDVISGATVSSKAILKSIENAISSSIK